MKKVTWMEIALAMPMALTFSSFGGITAIAITMVSMLVIMGILKWGVNEQKVQPIPVTSQAN